MGPNRAPALRYDLRIDDVLGVPVRSHLQHHPLTAAQSRRRPGAGAAVFLVAAAFSAAYLMGPQRLARLRLPGANGDLAGIPKSVSTFLLMGFIMWGTMIASGAIWAHVAWGRYWGWDPVELWSLISWVLYALLIHARLTFKLPARVFCILTIVTAGTVAFSLWGIQYVYDTIHTYG
jgi:ABC-type transport system involved in cytochrome c biogenesis permease subunit